MKIGEVMVNLGFLTAHKLDEMIRDQLAHRKDSDYVETLGNFLLRKGIITDDQLNQALLIYFKYLVNDNEQPPFVKETAKVAMQAMERKAGGERLSEESKITMLKKIHEYEEKIAYNEKSINALSNLEQKRVIAETIDKENKEIRALLEKIETLKKDLEKFS